MKEYNVYQSALRAQLLTTCGMDTVSIKNCREISIQIFKKDKNYISENTIRRFFGLIPNTYTPTPFVLDSLARFTGHDNWDQFRKQFAKTDIRHFA